MTAARNALRDSGAHTHEEVAWLASFGWRAEQIARRLGVTVDTVHAHVAGRRGGDPIRLAADPDPEPAVPVSYMRRKARK